MGHPLPPPSIDRDFEQTVLRRTTDHFIQTDPYTVELIPRVFQETVDGGREWVDGPKRPAQTFKLIEGVSTGDMARGEGGVRERTAQFTLLGQWDAIVKPYDHWEDENGQRLEVKFMMPYNGYEVRALVDSYGPQA